MLTGRLGSDVMHSSHPTPDRQIRCQICQRPTVNRLFNFTLLITGKRSRGNGAIAVQWTDYVQNQETL